MHFINLDLKDMIDTGERVLKICAILLILFSVLIVVLRDCFLHHFRERVYEIKSLFELISCRSIVGDDKLRNSFVGQADTWAIAK